MYIRLYNMLCKDNDNVNIFLSVLHGKYKLLTIISYWEFNNHLTSSC